MSLLKRSKKRAPRTAAPGPEPSASSEKVSAGAWKATGRTVRRTFPGPRGASALLRVAIDRVAQAELVAHAKESLEREICGVLAGAVCEDDEGVFVHVNAVIRGTAASHGSTHVTFTQETWNQIHTTLEKDFPKLQIVGWYHSHPGFGVEFSEMDLFIQKNFFSAPHQVALVIDPLSGAMAVCLNTPEGIQYLERVWVDGREQPCQRPKEKTAPSTPGNSASGPSDADATLRSIESRLGQLIQALDEQRTSYYRFLLFIGILVAAGVVFWIGYTFYSSYRYRNEPPQLNQFVPVPIQVSNKTVLIGVGVVQWDVPPELNATMLEVEREKQALAEKAAQLETNKPVAPAETNATPKP